MSVSIVALFVVINVCISQICDVSLKLCETSVIIGSGEPYGEFPYFGRDIAQTNEYMIIGEPGNGWVDIPDYADWFGAAYIYEKSSNGSWNKIKRLTGESDSDEDFFGFSVDITDNYAIIGAYYTEPLNSNNLNAAGAAYISELDTDTGIWSDAFKLSHMSIKDDRFGFAVSISSSVIGDWACVGAPNHDERGSSSGKVYIYYRNATEESWAMYQELLASDAGSGDNFGESVRIDGDYIIVGAPDYDFDGDSGTGAGYIFKFNETSMLWEEEAILLTSEISPTDYVGRTCDISRYGYAIIGSKDYDDGGNINSGRAYIFERNINGNWIESKVLKPDDNKRGDSFGWITRIYSNGNGNTKAIIGAYIDNDLGTNAGSAYLYGLCNNEWIELQEIFGDDTNLDDRFGGSVSISDNEVNVGAYRKNGAQGYVYTFNYKTECISTTLGPNGNNTNQNDSKANQYIFVYYVYLVVLLVVFVL